MPLSLTVSGQTVYKSLLKKVGWVVVFGFALIGFVLSSGYLALRLGLTKEKGIIDRQDEVFINSAQDADMTSSSKEWARGQEWQTLKSAILKDSETIDRAAKDAGIEPRLLVAILVPEQLRLFHSEREIFKQIFEPLQILGNQNQFSWGIMGLKKETAEEIENHLKDKKSEYYLGLAHEDILDFETADIGQERFQRLTDDKDHYYNYLYAALYLAQIEHQWNAAGYDISNRPEILATLYNIGFVHSEPKANPSSGGSAIEIGGKTYSFGNLAGQFYYSKELVDLFPR
ncbi:MAG: hypothetical protein WCT02_01970 [Candidatus Paceibacterota bacterium]